MTTAPKRSYSPREAFKSGVNDVNTLYPELTPQWSKRNALEPESYHVGSTSYAFWLCAKNSHEIKRVIRLFVQAPENCSICAGQEILPGFNDLTVTNPELAISWDYERNEKDPATISSGSKNSYYWICSEGHSYKATPHNRKNGRACPICFGRVALPGYNDLASKNPELTKEWPKANAFGPETVTPGSGKFALWVCKQCDHEWSARIAHRSAGHGCPECGSKSRLEERVAYWLKSSGILYKRRFRGMKDEDGRRRELDFLLREYSLAFEVQDFATHSKISDYEKTDWPKRFGVYKNGPTYHTKKKKAAEALGIKLVELWQDEILNDNFKKMITEEINHVINAR